MEIKAAAAQRFTILRDGRLTTVWVPCVNLPSVLGVWVAKDGEMAQFDTEQEANEYAEQTAARWQKESTRQ